MSCSCRFHIKMPQMSVAPGLWLNGTTELILDTSKNKSKKKKCPCHHDMSNARVYLGKSMPNFPAGTTALCLWIVSAPVIFHCEFCDAVLQEAVEVCRKGSRGKHWECWLSGSCFQVWRMLVWCCNLPWSQAGTYRTLNLKWTKEGNPSLDGAQH